VLLKPRTWLNDEVMNFYCAMIVDACNARLKLADAWGEKQGLNPLKARRQWVGPHGELAMDVHAFSTFFFSKLEDPNAGYVKGRLNRWTKKVLVSALCGRPSAVC
jgi:sentrin-specific protease 1